MFVFEIPVCEEPARRMSLMWTTRGKSCTLVVLCAVYVCVLFVVGMKALIATMLLDRPATALPLIHKKLADSHSCPKTNGETMAYRSFCCVLA